MRNVHLLVLIHGMWGNPGHLDELHRIITEVKGQNPSDSGEEGDSERCCLEVLLAQTNSEESTYDGFDWGGERIAEEVYEKKSQIEKDGDRLVKFSVTGYSLGGLIGRYLIGILFHRNFFDNIQPVNFTTIATPHLGIPRYSSFFSTLAHSLGPRLLSRSGEQFFGVDHWSAHGRPLLLVMADKDRIFYQALQLFPHVTFYANAINDVTVPYVTAAVDTMDPFAEHATNGIEIEFDPVYDPIIKSWKWGEPAAPETPPPVLSIAWFRSRDFNSILPPRFQYRFPINLVMLTLIPILIPTFFTIIIVRLSLSSRSSRARIKLLESEEENSRSRLISFVAKLEKGVEDTVVEILDDPGTGPNSPPMLSGTTTPETSESSSQPLSRADFGNHEVVYSSKAKKGKSKQPQLTSKQLLMSSYLNSLPQLKKFYAFIEGVRNSHAVIVSRDVKSFAFHRRGEGVIRHWADHFVL